MSLPPVALLPAPLLLWLVVARGPGTFTRLWAAYEKMAAEPGFKLYDAQRLSIVASRAFGPDTLGRITWEQLAWCWGEA